MNTLQVQAGGIALNMYHSEVPLETARRFINNLVARQFWAAYDPQELYYDEVVQMFTEAGASQGEAAQYANTLEHKRQLAQ
jgi:hypothetical protein